MYTADISTRSSLRLPRLVATGVICLLFGMNTHADASSTSKLIHAHASAPVVMPLVMNDNVTRNVQVLSAEDERLYRSIFAAQAKADWKSADAAIAAVSDEGLLGHVYADRYARRTPTAAELKAWLVSYAQLPEADDIYDQVRTLPSAKGAKITKPDLADIWAGRNTYGTSFEFRTDVLSATTPEAQRFEARLTHSLRKGDPTGAEDVLYTELEHRPLGSEELSDAQARIAAGYFYSGATAQAHDLSVRAATSSNPLALWIAGLTAWKQKDMAAASIYFVTLASRPNLSLADKTAAQFWAARALTRTGDTVKAKSLLQEAAKQPRSFYGLLAASLVNKSTVWSWELPALSRQNVGVLEKSPAGFRALALIQIGQISLAETELRHLNPQGRRDLQNAMLALAENEHMPSLALQLGGVATAENGRLYDAALYPVPPWQPEQGFRVDRALMYALMRRESFFDPTAVSDRGACGLMQLMPETANLMAKRKVVGSADCSGRMLEPSFNMALGQEYVRRLSQQPLIGNNLLFLLAAYNGGPGKLAHWTEDQTVSDPLLFVESLPLHETRDYVQQVLVHYWTYRARLDEPMTSMSQLAKGEWPRYALRDELRTSKTLKTAMAPGYAVASNGK